jgi:hypothetical protein
MKKKIKQPENWSQDIYKLNDIADSVIFNLRKFEKNSGEVIKAPDSNRPLREQVWEIKWLASKLHEVLLAGPIRTVFSADRLNLTAQQYFLLRARGFELFTAKQLGISPVGDYECYRMCVYKNEQAVCFMDPDETPEVKTVDNKTGHKRIRIRLAHSPEECELKHLRPEQREFFTKHRPDVLERMKADETGY